MLTAITLYAYPAKCKNGMNTAGGIPGHCMEDMAESQDDEEEYLK